MKKSILLSTLIFALVLVALPANAAPKQSPTRYPVPTDKLISPTKMPYPTVDPTVYRNVMGISITPTPTSNVDLLQKYIKEKRLALEKDIQEKTKMIQTQRKACQDSITAYQKQRNEKKSGFMKTCLVKPTTTPANAAEAATLSAQFRAQVTECQTQLKAMDTETKTQVASMKATCKSGESQVLGIHDGF